ncbi:MAG: hypothetical protein L3J13_04145, partial [Devosiaceae bacterium]|nr:hypothetical protein [Devosiaceae bacterium]
GLLRASANTPLHAGNATFAHASRSNSAAPAARSSTAAISSSAKEQPPVSSGVDTDFYDLAEALCTGHEQIVFLSAFDPEGDCTGVGEMLISEILANGRSVAIVDAGSGVISSQPGISDLAANEAEFGEVVFHSEDDGLTEIYWGTRRNIYSASEKPATLVEALCDICDVVLVFVGGVGATSNLPLFAGLDGTLTMVAGAQPEYSSSQRALDEAQALGFARSQLLVMPKNHANAA